MPACCACWADSTATENVCRITWHALVALGLVLLLGACAGPQQRPPEQAAEQLWAQRQARLEVLSAWQLQGRASLRSPEDSGTAGLYWAQQPGHVEVRLSGPFGQGALVLRADADGATIDTGDGRHYTDTDAQRLLERVLHQPLPIEPLRHWALGLPTPDAPSDYRLDAEGRLASLSQHGWEIDYRGYRRFGALDLPIKLFARSGPYEVRIVVSRWQTGADDED